MEKNTTEGFVFLNSFYEAINEIDDKQVRDEITSAIITFGITENVDFEQLSPVARFGMKIIIPIIEKQKAKYRNKKAVGSLGGRPKKSDSEKPNENQECNFEKPNDNQKAQNNAKNENQNSKTEKPNININNNTNINIKKENENKKEIVCKIKNLNAQSAENTHTEILNSFLSLEFVKENGGEEYAKKLADDFIDYNKDKPETFWTSRQWERYIVRFLENDHTHKPKESSGKEKLPGRFDYQEYCTAITSHKFVDSDFERTTDKEGKIWWVLKKSA